MFMQIFASPGTVMGSIGVLGGKFAIGEYVYVYTDVYVCVCVYIYIYTCVYMCMYILNRYEMYRRAWREIRDWRVRVYVCRCVCVYV